MRPTRDLSDIPLGPSLTGRCHVRPRLLPNQGAVSLVQGRGLSIVGQPCVESSVPRQAAVSKVLIKVVNKGKKNARSKTFTLRNVNATSIDKLRALIREQLVDEIVKGKFDIGYLKNNTVVNIRTEEDLCEIMDSLRGGVSVVLWCDGLETDELTVTTSTSTSKKKPLHVSDSDSDDGDVGTSKRKKSDNEVQKIVDDLKKRHGEQYTFMQIRIWAESIHGGIHNSRTEPPTTSMFNRASGSSPSNAKKNSAICYMHIMYAFY